MAQPLIRLAREGDLGRFSVRGGRFFRPSLPEDEQATGLYVLAGFYYLILTTCIWMVFTR